MANQDLGVDVNRQWQQFDDDLVLVDGVDNVEQAIFNRLTCPYNDMNYFYWNYGSKIKKWLGEPNTEQGLSSLASEVEMRVMEDPRVTACECKVVKINAYQVAIHLQGTIDKSIPFANNFVLNVATNLLATSDGRFTYINMSLYRWSCKKRKRDYEVIAGTPLPILSRVFVTNDEPVPIGVVDYYMNSKFIGSVEVKKGIADYTYTIPSNTPTGRYVITAHYRGLGSFGSSKKQIEVLVVNKLTTITKFKYKYLFGIAGEKVQFPVSVKDVNENNVQSGTVCYSIKIGGEWRLATDLTISNMYKKFNDPKAVFQNSTVVDEWGFPVPCGKVCYYINNGDGILRATRNLLNNSYTSPEDVKTFFSSQIIDDENQKVLFGNYCWYLRKSTGIPMSTTSEANDTEAYHGLNNEFYSTVTDSEGYPVTDGIFCWYIKCIRECRPFVTKTEITSTDVKNLKAFLRAKVTDRDDIPVPDGDICYSYTDEPIDEMAFDISKMPVEFSAKNLDTNQLSNNGLRAVIVDKDGVVIDRGKFVTITDDGETVSTYVSSDGDDDEDNTEDEENIVEFKLQEANRDGKA